MRALELTALVSSADTVDDSLGGSLHFTEPWQVESSSLHRMRLLRELNERMHERIQDGVQKQPVVSKWGSNKFWQRENTLRKKS